MKELQSKIRALVKYKYYDFIVNEIFDGEVVTLTNTDVPEYEEYNRVVSFMDAGGTVAGPRNLDAIKQIY